MVATLQPACYGVVSTFFALSTITILLRLYSRGLVIRSIGWDDWCMVGVFALFVEELYYVWMHCIIKMAFLLFYLRFATKSFRKLVYCTIAVNVIFTVLQWLLYCFQCVPLKAFFDAASYPNVKCLDNKILAFLPAACSIFTDACIVLLPIQPLWTIQVSLRKRCLLIGIVSLGGIVVLISCLRLTVLLEFQKMTDFTYSLGKIIIISSLELEVAIMAANAPALKIFFSQAFNRKRPDTRDGPSSPSYKLSHLSRRNLKHNQATIISYHAKGHYSRHITTRDEQNSSSEVLAEDKSGILVTSSIGVESRSITSSKISNDHYEVV
ncbi:integral membrane family protein [Phlyctema vagabunda]|uniref:Integral membrane family protein n=1 Tax=Phlyctema vagabunda TaxID=108571 RepID=A0ABR4PW89_9HELO